MYTYHKANSNTEREWDSLSSPIDTPRFLYDWHWMDTVYIPFFKQTCSLWRIVDGYTWTRFVLQAVARHSVHKQRNDILTIGTCGL